MITVYDVNPNKLIEATAQELKKNENVKAPEWATFVKTSSSRERVPSNKDWWYVRAASILRKVYVNKIIGTGRLKTAYGGRKNRGYKPERQRDGSGNIIRKCLQQLEAANLVKKEKKGRSITPLGQKMLDNMALKVNSEKETQVKKDDGTRGTTEETTTTTTTDKPAASKPVSKSTK
ncbi:MAG: 30S ribosomal protein S19e [DPANN group archaeon]|nr:30S ribosomal protein S19e [DPANN group archaeon]